MFKQAFFWAVLTSCVWGVVPILEKIGLTKINPTTGLFIRCTGVVFGALLLLLLKFPAIKSELAILPTKNILFIFLGGFLASFVAQFLFYTALKLGEASKTTTIAAAYPLITFLLALFVLGEQFTLAKFFGICSILLGIFLLK